MNLKFSFNHRGFCLMTRLTIKSSLLITNKSVESLWCLPLTLYMQEPPWQVCSLDLLKLACEHAHRLGIRATIIQQEHLWQLSAIGPLNIGKIGSTWLLSVYNYIKVPHTYFILMTSACFFFILYSCLDGHVLIKCWNLKGLCNSLRCWANAGMLSGVLCRVVTLLSCSADIYSYMYGEGDNKVSCILCLVSCMLWPLYWVGFCLHITPQTQAFIFCLTHMERA